jgi:hypothetical protein
MNELTTPGTRIASMSEPSIDLARDLERELMALPQEGVATDHLIHAGIYARTIKIPANMVCTGALIKIATLLIISGHVTVNTDDGAIELIGYRLVPASANRKQAFITHSDTWLTMIFKTQAQVVEQAEDEFTDEPHLLLTRRGLGKQTIVITGE